MKIKTRRNVEEVPAVPEVAPTERLVEIPKTKRTSVTGRKSIESGEVNLEESKEFITGENSGWVAADRLSKDFQVSEEDFATAEFIDKAHFDPYAPDIPKYILKGTEEQGRSYGMGFDVGVSNAVKAGLEATPVVAKPPAVEKAKAEVKYKELMKTRLEAHDREIKVANDAFMAGKISSKEMDVKHKAIHKKTDAAAAIMRKRVWGEYPETLPSRAELEKIQRMRTSRSQASDLARQHSVVISPDNPKVATWLKDQGTADIQGIDTPPISRRGSKISRRTPRITPKAGRLK